MAALPTIPERNLIAPRELPDGRIVWEEHTDIGRKLREGDPLIGWDGDDSLSLILNTAGPRWEVWQRCPDGVARLLLWRNGTRIPGNDLLVEMMRGDTRRHDVAAETLAHNERVDAERRKQFDEQVEARADKLAWALGRDLSEPAQSGRLYGVR